MINVTALADGTRRGRLGLRAVEGLAPDASHLNQLAAIAYLGIQKVAGQNASGAESPFLFVVMQCS